MLVASICIALILIVFAAGLVATSLISCLVFWADET